MRSKTRWWADQSLVQVPATLANLRELKVLDISNNKITSLPLQFCELSQLDRLHLDGNDWTVPSPDIRARGSVFSFRSVRASALVQMSSFRLVISSSSCVQVPSSYFGQIMRPYQFMRPGSVFYIGQIMRPCQFMRPDSVWTFRSNYASTSEV